MADVLLTADDITVLGGPSSVSIDLDFGPEGQRGSQIFVGAGKPNNIIIGQTPEIFDLYINNLVGDSEYLHMYQYVVESGLSTWKSFVKLIPNTYSINLNKVFTNGSTEINVKLADIVSGSLVSSLQSKNFSIQYSVLNLGNPVSSTLAVGAVDLVGGFRSLPIIIDAVEFNGTSWVDLSGTRTIHLLITVV